MKFFFNLTLSLMLVFCIHNQTTGQSMSDATFKGLQFRNIGPAFTSGRIADIAVHPNDENTWYVGVGSGGVWKTQNAGVTWEPIFDDQPVYSIGCVTIDPNNPHTIWVGTGENVGGRHVAFGDGVYMSSDDGKSWKNMGLKESQHISKIIIHPENSDIIWVAAQGPLWNSGGERGLYKSVDGGKTWKNTLSINEWTGVTDIAVDPNNPDWIYAATWQRHRTIAALMGGGPGSGIHRSTDGGETWQKLTMGIPKSNIGKIGIAISPQNSDYIYAAIEMDRTTGGVFLSTNRGASWTKQSDAVSGATGPHYYQELYASPHQEGRLYLMDNNIQISDDFGKTFRRMERSGQHSDNHSIIFRKNDPDYLLIGTDGGIYESYDLAKTWRFIDNMPITQYYGLAVDDAIPFYFVYGGTQDNGSHAGPSRTDTQHGIRNADWFKTLGADGYQTATEPGNPNISYAETQEGGIHRIDRLTGEQVFVQPQPREGENFERFNWDAPIVVSAHNPARIYTASYRVWRSENRGDSWTPISNDLTRNQERIALPIMGKRQSWDNAWDVGAMSNYNTISTMAESSVDENVLFAGTDDGIIQVTTNGGQSWTKIEVGTIKGIPSTAFVNDIKADLFDANVAYAALDNHKYGDFKPYLIKTADKGKTWTSITANLPQKLLVWRIVQDHVKKDLLFTATEFGIYFTSNGGIKWYKLEGGLPTISFRGITIQRRENDLVAASFGRSFYILDDYSPLREITEESLKKEAILFSAKPAYWYRERSVVSSQGTSKYAADNPPFGAVFTYYLSNDLKSNGDQRKEREKKLNEQGAEIPFPGWDVLEAERRQQKPKIILTIKDIGGNIVNVVDGKNSNGLNRVNWDLRYASKNGVSLEQRGGGGGFFRRGGFLASPGTYSVTLSKIVDGKMTDLAGPMNFEVVPLRAGALEGSAYDEIAAFRKILETFQQDLTATGNVLDNNLNKVKAMQTSFSRADQQPADLYTKLFNLREQLLDLDIQLNGNQTKGEIGERSNPTPGDRLSVGFRGLSTTYGPTASHKESVELGKKQLSGIKQELSTIVDTSIPEIENALKAIGAPPIEGQGLIDN